jgi:hypothetical protein
MNRKLVPCKCSQCANGRVCEGCGAHAPDRDKECTAADHDDIVAEHLRPSEVRWADVRDALVKKAVEDFEEHYAAKRAEDPEAWPERLPRDEWLVTFGEFLTG